MIRPAEQRDASAIGSVYCEGWKAAYRGLMPAFFLNALTPENCAPKPDHIAPDRRLVAELDGEVVGTVTFGKGREDASLAEIQSIYVLPDYWNRGQGSGLRFPLPGNMDRPPGFQIQKEGHHLRLREKALYSGRNIFPAQQYRGGQGQKCQPYPQIPGFSHGSLLSSSAKFSFPENSMCGAKAPHMSLYCVCGFFHLGRVRSSMRRFLKNSCRSAVHSASRMPFST